MQIGVRHPLTCTLGRHQGRSCYKAVYLGPTMRERRAYAQIRIYARNSRFSDRVWKRREPPLGLPFPSILPPDGFIGVGRLDANDDCCVLRHEYFVHHRAVNPHNRLAQRENSVLTRPVQDVSGFSKTIVPHNGLTHSRYSRLTGA